MTTEQPDRHALQAAGAHPAPCARHCESTAFHIALRRLQSENEALRAGYDAARLEIASLQAQLEALASQAQPVGAVPAKVLTGVIELAKAAHAHWDADRDAKVGKILMAMAGWNEGYDWRADALHAAAAAPQPAAKALDSVRVFWQQHTQADALSMTMAELHDDVELVIRAAQVQAMLAKGLARVPLTDEQVQDLLQIGNPTEEETRLIQLGWNAANGITAAQKGGQHAEP